jgi:hypothetical protein
LLRYRFLNQVPDIEDKDSNTFPYREAIGSLMYLMIGTRPDLAYAIGKLSQHCENQSKSNWLSVKRVFRYLKGTCNKGITLGSSLHNVENTIRLSTLSDTVIQTGLDVTKIENQQRGLCSYLQGELYLGAQRNKQ